VLAVELGLDPAKAAALALSDPRGGS
jgi:hypothetical protein